MDPQDRPEVEGFYVEVEPGYEVRMSRSQRDYYYEQQRARYEYIDLRPVVGWRQDAEWQNGTVPPVLVEPR